MEKLLRDLNIYAHSFMNCNLIFTYDGNRIRVLGDEIGPYVAESIILNKKFGFIKWLVENEKIEGEKFQEPKIRGIIGLISNWHNSEGKSYKDYSKELAYESLLMLLSIEDEPIEFLVSILK